MLATTFSLDLILKYTPTSSFDFKLSVCIHYKRVLVEMRFVVVFFHSSLVGDYRTKIHLEVIFCLIMVDP